MTEGSIHVCTFPGCDEASVSHEGFVVRVGTCDRHRPIFMELGEVVRSRVERAVEYVAGSTATRLASLLRF